MKLTFVSVTVVFCFRSYGEATTVSPQQLDAEENLLNVPEDSYTLINELLNMKSEIEEEQPVKDDSIQFPESPIKNVKDVKKLAEKQAKELASMKIFRSGTSRR